MAPIEGIVFFVTVGWHACRVVLPLLFDGMMRDAVSFLRHFVTNDWFRHDWGSTEDSSLDFASVM